MKKIKIFCFLLSAMAASTLSAQTLTVKITNIDKIKSSLMVGVFNSAKEFPESAYFRGQTVKVTAKTMTVTFADLPQGIYAVSVCHDLNENGKTDKNFLGIPKEPYGFSYSTKPDYEKCKFNFSSDTAIEIKLQ